MACEGTNKRFAVGDKVRVKLDSLTPGTIGFTGVIDRYDEDTAKATVLFDEYTGIGDYYPSELEYINPQCSSTDLPSSYSVEEQLIAVFSGDASIDDLDAEDSEDDNVNHPKHYTSHPSGVECADIAEHHDFCVGNAIKYLWRAGLKQDADKTALEKEIEDLKKAKWYIDRKISRLLKLKEDE
jgi:hypothetical protein